jgi:2,3-bisphosphoglycerate-independent phosphoglycerate mutase
MLITADHGNAELMLNDETSQPHTAHTTNLVPLLYIGRPARMAENGALSDIAPSLLYIMNMEIPPEMTGTPLLEWLPVAEEDGQADAALELHV